VVTHAVSANRALFDDKAIVITTRRDPEPITVLADRDKLIQVVTNLLSNAAKFTATGGSVSVRAGRDDGLAVIEVQDSGVGIPPGQFETIFEKFHQVGDTLTAKPEGTGLGLPISREIVERHGGTLTARDSSGPGSCFRVALPLAGPEQGASRPRQASPDLDGTELAADRSEGPAPAADVRIA
jgi:signal transduction histidine kinase